MNKKIVLCLALLPVFTLTSCGETTADSSAPSVTYYVEAKFDRYNEVKFASAFDETQFEIIDSNNTISVPVTASMVSGFDSKQLQFDQDLTAKVSYNNLSLDLVYKISSYYASDPYTLKLSADQTLTIDKLSGSSTLTSYTIPDTIPALPDPLNAWHVSQLTDYGFSDALQSLTLGKYTTSIGPGNFGQFTVVKPVTGGALNYQEGFLVDSVTKRLLGVSSTLSGDVTLPSSATSLAPFAFAAPNSAITSLTFPKGYKGLSYFGIDAYNLSGLLAFKTATDDAYYSADETGVLYMTPKEGYRVLAAVPAALSRSVANPLVLTNAGNRSLSLDAFYKHTLIEAVQASASTPSLEATFDVSTIKELILPNPNAVVTVTSAALKCLGATMAFKVPSALLSSYQADKVWSTVKTQISAIA